MKTNNLFLGLTQLAFIPASAAQQVFVKRDLQIFITILLVITPLLSVVGLYSLQEILFFCVMFLMYRVLTTSSFLATEQIKDKTKRSQREYLRGIFSLTLITLSLLYLTEARGPLWMLLVFPWRRLLAYGALRPARFVIAAILTVIAVLGQLALKSDNTILLNLDLILEALVQLTWLALFSAMLFAYTKLISTINDLRYKLDRAIGEQLNQNVTLESWSKVILKHTLEFTEATYATFQVVSRYSGSLNLVAVAKRTQREISWIDPADLAASARLTESWSDGITGQVAQSGQYQAIINVRENKKYVAVFPGVCSEIAAPVTDWMHDSTGGVLNVEYTGQVDKFKFVYEIGILLEIAQQIASTLSYVLLATRRNQLRELSVQISSFIDSNKIAYHAVNKLNEIYESRIGLWLTDESSPTHTLVLSAARDMPSSYGTKMSELSMAESKIGQFLASHREPKQLSQYIHDYVDHWKTYSSEMGDPLTIVLIPLIGIEKELGVILVAPFLKAIVPQYEIEMLGDLGRQIAIAVESSRRYITDRSQVLASDFTVISHDVGDSLQVLSDLAEEIHNLDSGAHSRSSERIQREVELLTEFTRLVTTTKSWPDLPMDRYDVQTLLNHAISIITGRKILNPNQIWVKSIPKKYRQVYCNSFVATSAIINIVKNAVRASTEDARVRITVSLDKSKRYVNIDIRNYGRPLSSEEKITLFEVGRTMKPAGHGIALRSYKALLERSGGLLELIQSNALHGTAFRIYLKVSGQCENDRDRQNQE